MPAAIIGKKIGMTRLYDDNGKNVPVTVIQAGPCFVSQLKTNDVDGYSAVQLAYGDVKPRNSTNPMIAHDFKAGLSPKREHREFRVSEEALAEMELGQEIKVDVFDSIKFVDVVGTSKGKGFAGVMKRWGYKGQLASHGVERKHRSPGSIGGRSAYLGGGRPKKGIKMPGRLGGERVTVRSMKVLRTDKEKNLLLIQGPVPGPKNGIVLVTEAKRLFKRKARLLEA